MADETYELTPQDRRHIEDAAEWFLGTRKPRTASEVRGVLVKLYLAGMLAATSQIKEEIEAIDDDNAAAPDH